MEIKMNSSVRKNLVASLVGLVAATSLLAGCGSGVQEYDRHDEAQRVQKVKDFDTIYKSVDGNWDALTPVQKEQVVKQFDGSELSARAAFAGAKGGPAAAQKVMQEGRAKGLK